MESRSFSTRFVPRLYQTRFRLAGGSLASIRAGLPPAKPLFSAINGIFDIVFALLACYTRQCASLLGIAGEAALVGLPPWVLFSAPYLAKARKRPHFHDATIGTTDAAALFGSSGSRRRNKGARRFESLRTLTPKPKKPSPSPPPHAKAGEGRTTQCRKLMPLQTAQAAALAALREFGPLTSRRP